MSSKADRASPFKKSSAAVAPARGGMGSRLKTARQALIKQKEMRIWSSSGDVNHPAVFRPRMRPMPASASSRLAARAGGGDQQTVAAGAAQVVKIDFQRLGPAQDRQAAEEQEQRQQHAADPVDAGKGIFSRTLPGRGFGVAEAAGHPDAGFVVNPQRKNDDEEIQPKKKIALHDRAADLWNKGVFKAGRKASSAP